MPPLKISIEAAEAFLEQKPTSSMKVIFNLPLVALTDISEQP
jgi:hypothetical protein